MPLKVLRVDGPVILDWGNGMRLQIGPPPAGPAPGPSAAAKGRAGRRPGPATTALIAVMQEDARDGRPRSPAEYLALLREAGHAGSAGSMSQIVNREAKRAFGRTFGRRGRANGRRGRPPASDGPTPTQLLRTQLAVDRAAGQVGNAGHYTRWLVDAAGIGLKRARPIVYRELRLVRNAPVDEADAMDFPPDDPRRRRGLVLDPVGGAGSTG